MPYPNEHAARLLSPDIEHERVSRTQGSGAGTVEGVKIPESIDVIWYIVKSASGEEVPRAQALRFPISKWTESEARDFVSKNKIKHISFEAAKTDGEDISVMRFDVSFIPKSKRTDEGYIRADAIVTRTGIFNYLNTDGSIRRELRKPEEVFAQDSMDSMKMIPITNGHPVKKFVDASNCKDLSIGSTGENIRADEKFLIAPLVINRADGVQAVEKGRKGLSLGYKADLVMEPGTWNGEKYDAYQKNIRYNHLAIVDSPRAGDCAKLHIDESEVQSLTPNNGGRKMPTFIIDGISYDAAQEVINALTKSQGENSELKTRLDSATKELDQTKAKRDELDAKVKTLEVVDHAAEISKGVSVRIDLLRKAEKVLDAEEMKKADSMSDVEIKKACIMKKHPDVKLDDKSADYVNARFDSVLETLGTESPNSVNDQKKKIIDGEKGQTRVDQNESRARMVERMKNGGEEKK